jgi:putative sigma-54 modulation protein
LNKTGENGCKGAFMTKSILAVGFDLEKNQSELIDSKLKRISYADDLIVSLTMHIKHDKAYSFDITVNFRWGAQAHVTNDDFDFAAGLNKVMDVLDYKIKKEKDKVQEKK